MNFSIAKIISGILAPRHELSCSWRLWQRLLKGLRERGRNRTRESGALLLGQRANGRARVVAFILYDDLDPHCLDTGIVLFDGRHFGKVWEICRARKVSVVADIHVHPGGVGQSELDRANPMISRAGHVALIVGYFAAPRVKRNNLGIYKYKGAKQWDVIPTKQRRRFFHIGI
jgi:hypothetical protein